MGLISPPKWPSVNPFSHPLGSKIGRKPMVNPSKWVNLKSNFLKFHHRNQAISGIEKARKMAYFRAFLALLSCRLSLAELRSATSCLEAVLLGFLRPQIVDITDFFEDDFLWSPMRHPYRIGKNPTESERNSKKHQLGTASCLEISARIFLYKFC